MLCNLFLVIYLHMYLPIYVSMYLYVVLTFYFIPKISRLHFNLKLTEKVLRGMGNLIWHGIRVSLTVLGYR